MVAQRVDLLLPPMPTFKRLRTICQNQVTKKRSRGGEDSPRLADLVLGLELVGLDGRSHGILSIDDLGTGTAVDKLGPPSKSCCLTGRRGCRDGARLWDALVRWI
jgi:hypothetical protein